MRRAWAWTALALRSWPQQIGEGSQPVRPGWHPDSSLHMTCWRKCRISVAGVQSRVSNRIVSDRDHEGLNIFTVQRAAERNITHKQEDANAPEPWDITEDKCLKTNSGPITSCRKQKGPRLQNLTDGGCCVRIVPLYFFCPCFRTERICRVWNLWLFCTQNEWISWLIVLCNSEF